MPRGRLRDVPVFFDIVGMMQEVGPKTPVLVTLKVKPGKKQAMIDLLNTPDGLDATRSYDGNLSLEAFFNDATRNPARQSFLTKVIDNIS